MKSSITKGLCFGLTSGVITTLGLIVGLNSSTHSSKIVIGGILVIAIADAMSDALGIHVAEESLTYKTEKQIWAATFSTFFAKMIFSSLFIIPFLLFDLSVAIPFSVITGIILIAVFSYYLARRRKVNPFGVVFEHVLIAILVVLATHWVGDWVGRWG